eukprot:1179848-Prorocentrum_minimum.AAC.3
MARMVPWCFQESLDSKDSKDSWCFPSLTLPGLARRSDKPSAARRPRGGRWEEAAHRQGSVSPIRHCIPPYSILYTSIVYKEV